MAMAGRRAEDFVHRFTPGNQQHRFNGFEW
jgi:hypothetical protein